MASSMTMPTASVSASSVSMLSVKPMAHMRAKVLMIDVGMAMAAITVERQLRRNSSTTSAARIAPTIRCSWTVVDRCLDELGLVADDPQLVAGGQARLDARRAARLTPVDDRDGVGSGLPADRQDHGGLAVDVGRRLGLLDAVLGAADVGAA